MGKIWIHVTDYINWTKPPVGTIRVEQKIIKFCINNLPETHFFVYDRDGKFTPVATADIVAKLNRESFVGRSELMEPLEIFNPDIKSCDNTSITNTEVKAVKLLEKDDERNFFRKIISAFHHLFLSFFNSAYHKRINNFMHKLFILKTADKKNPMLKLPSLNELKFFFRLIKSAFVQLFWSFLGVNFHNKLNHSLENQNVNLLLFHPFKDGDVVLCLGGTWNFAKISLDIKAIKNSVKIKFFAVCHDLIPIKLPQCSVVCSKSFANYLKDLSLCADHVFCISKSTEKDYLQFLSALKISIPKTSIIKEGCEIYDEETVISSALKPLIERDFILFVATIESRKNHVCIYKALLYLLEQGHQNLPLFVFVGLKGWGVTDLIQELNLDTRVRKHILMLSDIDDPDLSILYKKCLFSVYPSYYEGWGLPIAESLAYGKFVIASASSSLPEVGGEFADYVNPYDTVEWAKRIIFYVSHRDELAKKETIIREKYKKNLWHDCCVELFQTILSAEEPVQSLLLSQ